MNYFSKHFNLVLVSRPEINDVAEFHRLGQYVREIDPAIRPFVVFDKGTPRRALLRRLQLLSRPTFVFSPARCTRFGVRRGAICQGFSLSKIEELQALRRTGTTVPDYECVTEQHRPDLSHLGDYVVVKPDRGGRGANVKIMRHSRVKWEPQETRIAGKSDALVAQRFIYTGQWPISYRVTTLFGKALWSYRAEADRARRPLESANDFRQAGGLSVVATGRNCRMELSNDPEVIAFAESAHAAFPDHPLLGIDVIREQPTGRLYILEVNSSGYVWHFSSPLGLKFQQEFGINLEAQFDVIRKAAGILAHITRERAI
jgi:hypothetical protein